MPYKIEGEILYVAMLDPFALNIIDEIESRSGYRVAPSICLEEEFKAFIGDL